MLSKREFAERIVEEMKPRMAREGLVESVIREVNKPEGLRTGISFCNPDADGLVVTPLRYIEDEYEMYVIGRASIEELAAILSNDYLEAIANAPVNKTNTMDLTDFNKMKNRIIVCATNREMSREYLEPAVKKNISYDAVLYLRAIVHVEENNVASFMVTPETMTLWGVDNEEELFELAWENTRAFLDPKPIDLVDHLVEKMGLPNEMVEGTRGCTYLVASKYGFNGGVFAFDEKTLSEVCKKIGEDHVYVIPSSTDEILVLPETKAPPAYVLNDMVRDVNIKEVEPEKMLSNYAYEFDAITKQLSVIEESIDIEDPDDDIEI